jgi:hypothetical protein
MDTLFIPTEKDFKRWLKEAVDDYFANTPTLLSSSEPNSDEALLNRKQIAGILKISLVTLHDWMNKGLPYHKQGGRVYFLRSEVVDYLKRKQGRPIAANR